MAITTGSLVLIIAIALLVVMLVIKVVKGLIRFTLTAGVLAAIAWYLWKYFG